VFGEISSSDYIMARAALNDALQEVSKSGVDITSPAFKPIFKREVLHIYERVLDDPETYKVHNKEQKEEDTHETN
jgi:hypothetical protein